MQGGGVECGSTVCGLGLTLGCLGCCSVVLVLGSDLVLVWFWQPARTPIGNDVGHVTVAFKMRPRHLGRPLCRL